MWCKTVSLFCLCLLISIPKPSYSLDPNAIISVFNVTYQSGGVQNIAITLMIAYPNFETAIEEVESRGFSLAVTDPCQSLDLTPCSENADCLTVDPDNGLIQCKCKSGFNQTASFRELPQNSGIVPDGTFCPDIDECDRGIDNCSALATCTNIPGAFNCSCDSGYTGNGTTCFDIDECALDPCHVNASCENSPGSHDCSCNAGFIGNGILCQELVECSSSVSNNCHENATCAVIEGNITCICNDGFTGDGVTCTDMDECSMRTDNCDANALCSNTPGSFTCSCNTGYSGNGFNCDDIDECFIASTCHVNATCENQPGNFSCACDPGFVGDGFSCREECPGNQVFSTCASCFTRCEDRSRLQICTQECRVQCTCPPNTFLLEEMCVTEEECPDTPEPTCTRDCGSGGKCVINLLGNEDCECSSGYALLNGVCSEECPGNQVFSTCASCFTRCEDRSRLQICTQECRVQCTCPPNTFLLGEMCVTEEECPDIPTTSFCYSLIANVNSTSVWSNSSFSELLIDQITMRFSQASFPNQDLPSVIVSLEDGLLEPTQTRYVVRVCLNETTVTTTDLSLFINNQVSFIVGSIEITLSNFDECAYQYDSCVEPLICEDTLGSYKCVESKINRELREISTKIFLCFYSPFLGFRAFIECLQLKYSLLHRLIDNSNQEWQIN